MYQIDIESPVIETPKFRDSFLITCVASGISDDTKEIKLALFPNKPEYMPYLQEAIDFCERMQATELNYQTRDYTNVEGGDRWLGFNVGFGPSMKDPDTDTTPPIYYELTAVNEQEGWPHDPRSDYMVPGYFQSYKVRYFDKDGVEHRVKVTHV